MKLPFLDWLKANFPCKWTKDLAVVRITKDNRIIINKRLMFCDLAPCLKSLAQYIPYHEETEDCGAEWTGLVIDMESEDEDNEDNCSGI